MPLCFSRINLGPILFRDSDFEDLATGRLLSLGPTCGTLSRPKSRDAGTYGARGAIAPLAFSSRGARGAKVPFSKNITLKKSKYFKKR